MKNEKIDDATMWKLWDIYQYYKGERYYKKLAETEQDEEYKEYLINEAEWCRRKAEQMEEAAGLKEPSWKKRIKFSSPGNRPLESQQQGTAEPLNPLLP